MAPKSPAPSEHTHADGSFDEKATPATPPLQSDTPKKRGFFSRKKQDVSITVEKDAKALEKESDKAKLTVTPVPFAAMFR